MSEQERIGEVVFQFRNGSSFTVTEDTLEWALEVVGLDSEPFFKDSLFIQVREGKQVIVSVHRDTSPMGPGHEIVDKYHPSTFG